MSPLVFAAAIVLAHGWYDPECCSARDCRPAIQGEIVVKDGGYQIGEDRLAFNDRRVRPSQDAQSHVCRSMHNKALLCIYVPIGA